MPPVDPKNSLRVFSPDCSDTHLCLSLLMSDILTLDAVQAQIKEDATLLHVPSYLLTFIYFLSQFRYCGIKEPPPILQPFTTLKIIDVSPFALQNSFLTST